MQEFKSWAEGGNGEVEEGVEEREGRLLNGTRRINGSSKRQTIRKKRFGQNTSVWEK